MAHTEIKSLLPWRQEAEERQQNYAQLFGEYDWDCYEYSQRNHLEQKVGFALYGPPTELPSSLVNSKSAKDINHTGYPARQYENIKKVCSAIYREDVHGQDRFGETFMSIIFVCLEIPRTDSSASEVTSSVQSVPIFRVPNYSRPAQVSFIDPNARVYKDWNDFLKNNELPKCRYCFPWSGKYQTDFYGFVLVEFGETPACKVKKKVLTALDTTSAVLSLGTVAAVGASFFVPIAAPVMAGMWLAGLTSNTYGIVRTSTTLADRAKHKQSIGWEARNHWLSLAGSVVGTAAIGASTAVTKMTQAGQVIGRAGRVTMNALSVSSLTVNGLGVLNGAFMLQNKLKHNELTPLDIFQFTTSVLFFTHSAVTLKTADTFIRETQADVIQKYQENSTISRVFTQVTRRNMNTIEGRAKVIRNLQEIESKTEFLSRVVHFEKYLPGVKGAGIKINGQLPLDHKNLMKLGRDLHQIIMKAIQKLAEGITTWEEITKAAKSIWSKQNALITQCQFKDRMDNLCDLLKNIPLSNISSNAASVLTSVAKDGMPRIYEIMINYDKKLYLRILEVAVQLLEYLANFTGNWFLKILDFTCKVVCNIVSAVEDRYQEDLRMAEMVDGGEFDREQFDRNYNISGGRFEHFCSIVLEQFLSDPSIVSSLNKGFSRLNYKIMS